MNRTALVAALAAALLIAGIGFWLTLRPATHAPRILDAGPPEAALARARAQLKLGTPKGPRLRRLAPAPGRPPGQDAPDPVKLSWLRKACPKIPCRSDVETLESRRARTGDDDGLHTALQACFHVCLNSAR